MSHNTSHNRGNDGAGGQRNRDQRNGDQRNASSSQDIAARVVNALENDEGMRPYGIKAEAYGQKVRLSRPETGGGSLRGRHRDTGRQGGGPEREGRCNADGIKGPWGPECSEQVEGRKEAPLA